MPMSLTESGLITLRWRRDFDSALDLAVDVGPIGDSEGQSDDRGSPLRMFEDEHKLHLLLSNHSSPSFSKRPVVALSRRAPRRGDDSGADSFGYFSSKEK